MWSGPADSGPNYAGKKKKPSKLVSILTERCFLQICAIIGGTFTVAGIIDSCIFTASEAWKKIQIGKMSWGRPLASDPSPYFIYERKVASLLAKSASGWKQPRDQPMSRSLQPDDVTTRLPDCLRYWRSSPSTLLLTCAFWLSHVFLHRHRCQERRGNLLLPLGLMLGKDVPETHLLFCFCVFFKNGVKMAHICSEISLKTWCQHPPLHTLNHWIHSFISILNQSLQKSMNNWRKCYFALSKMYFCDIFSLCLMVNHLLLNVLVLLFLYLCRQISFLHYFFGGLFYTNYFISSHAKQ